MVGSVEMRPIESIFEIKTADHLGRQIGAHRAAFDFTIENKR